MTSRTPVRGGNRAPTPQPGPGKLLLAVEEVIRWGVLTAAYLALTGWLAWLVLFVLTVEVARFVGLMVAAIVRDRHPEWPRFDNSVADWAALVSAFLAGSGIRPITEAIVKIHNERARLGFLKYFMTRSAAAGVEIEKVDLVELAKAINSAEPVSRITATAEATVRAAARMTAAQRVTEDRRWRAGGG